MNTDVKYLEMLEEDLRAAAAREGALAPPSRPRRRRTWPPILAASISVLVVAGLIGWLATGSQSARETGSVPDLGLSGGAGASASTVVPTAGPQSGPAAHAAASPGEDLSKIIRDGSISIQLARGDFEKAFAAVTRIASTDGGFVLASSSFGERSGTLTLRIPASRFDRAMIALRSVGAVQSQNIAGKDVTAEFVDLRARLTNALAQRVVLRRLMASATTIGDTLTVQSHLQDVQLQIEQIQGQLHFIQNQVAESTIRVDLAEKHAPRPAPSDGIKNPSLATAFHRALQGSLNVAAAVLVGLGYLIPIGLIAFAIWSITAWVRRRRAAS